MMSKLDTFFASISCLVNAELDWLIPATGNGPQSLRDAMRWSLFAGGKHFRPALVFATGRTFGVDDNQLVRTAAAVEMIHTYSLIHDDLPSMDDDDLRRGRETCHRKFGEATAILAGDALQVLAFQAISEDERLSWETRIKLVSGLSQAAAKMVRGQQLDLEAEGKDVSIEELKQIHENKTGALIAFSVTSGAIVAEVGDAELAMVADYASKIGLLFQITDDLLDVTQKTEILGKTAGKDVASGKATYPSVFGVEQTKSLMQNIHHEAIATLDRKSENSEILLRIADFVLERTS